MSNSVTVESTTDTQEDVNLAAGITAAPEENKPEAEKTAEISSATGADGNEEEKPPAGKGGFQKRIDRLTREKYETAEKYNKSQEEIRELTAKLAKLSNQPAEVKTTEDPQPKKEDFTDYEEYLDARSAWKARQEFNSLHAKAQENEQQQAEQEEAKATFDAYNERVNEAKTRHDDFDEVLLEAAEAGINLPQSAILAIYELDNGPDVAYHLAKNSDLCEKLRGMSALKAVAEVGKLAEKLAVSPVKKDPEEKPEAEEKKPTTVKLASKAPAPIVPVGGHSTKSTADPGEMSQADYKKWYAKQFPNSR